MFKLACTTAAGIGLLVAGTALAAGQPSMDKFKAVSQVVGEKCMACHTQGYDLPFYAKVPGIKKIIEDIIAKIKGDKDIGEKFQKDPTKTVEGLIGVDLPDDQVNAVVEGVKAKLNLDGIADKLGGLFGGKG